MNAESWIGLVGVFVGALIATMTIWFTNKNNRQQIKTGKLEELFQALLVLSRYYGLFLEFWYKVQQLRDSNDKELQTLEQYYKLRDQRMTIDEREKISELLSRIIVLAECYTKDNLKQKILDYETLMYSFFEFVVQGGSVQQEIHFRNGYPVYENFYSIVKGLQDEIVKEIKL